MTQIYDNSNTDQANMSTFQHSWEVEISKPLCFQTQPLTGNAMLKPNILVLSCMVDGGRN